MRIALGSDHAGFKLKEDVKRYLEAARVPFVDFGTDSEASVDYPDYAARVAHAVAAHEVDRGILVCGTGIGMAMAANKVDGIRAASVTDLRSARLSREHNNINVLALAGRLTPSDLAREIVQIFLSTPFEGDRHQRRLDKIASLEVERDRGTPPGVKPPASAGH